MEREKSNEPITIFLRPIIFHFCKGDALDYSKRNHKSLFRILCYTKWLLLLRDPLKEFSGYVHVLIFLGSRLDAFTFISRVHHQLELI